MRNKDQILVFFVLFQGHSTHFHPFFLTSSHKHGIQSFLDEINFLTLAHLISAMMSAPPASIAVTHDSMTEATQTAQTAALSSVHSSAPYI